MELRTAGRSRRNLRGPFGPAGLDPRRAAPPDVAEAERPARRATRRQVRRQAQPHGRAAPAPGRGRGPGRGRANRQSTPGRMNQSSQGRGEPEAPGRRRLRADDHAARAPSRGRHRLRAADTGETVASGDHRPSTRAAGVDDTEQGPTEGRGHQRDATNGAGSTRRARRPTPRSRRDDRDDARRQHHTEVSLELSLNRIGVVEGHPAREARRGHGQRRGSDVDGGRPAPGGTSR